jgi:hypothetical protein
VNKSNCISAPSIQMGLKTVGRPDDARTPPGKSHAPKDARADVKIRSAHLQPNPRHLIVSLVAFIAFDSTVSCTRIGVTITPVTRTQSISGLSGREETKLTAREPQGRAFDLQFRVTVLASITNHLLLTLHTTSAPPITSDFSQPIVSPILLDLQRAD